MNDLNGWHDNVAEMLALVEKHPTLVWLRPESAGAPHAAVWIEDDGPQRAQRERLGDLVAYLQARFRPGR
jgi:hypothetical protein